MARVRSRNNALQFFVNGQRASDLSALAGIPDKVLSRYDTATQRAVVGLKRRALPVASRTMRDGYGVKASALANKVRVQDTTGRAGDGIALWASTRRIPLLEFSGRWGGMKTAGATAEVERGLQQTYLGAFIATVKGKKAIRVRKRDGSGKRVHRGPLVMLRGPSPFEMLAGLDQSAPSFRVRKTVFAELTSFYVAELRRQYALANK